MLKERLGLRERLGPRTNVQDKLGPRSNIQDRVGGNTKIKLRLGDRTIKGRLGNPGRLQKEAEKAMSKVHDGPHNESDDESKSPQHSRRSVHERICAKGKGEHYQPRSQLSEGLPGAQRSRSLALDQPPEPEVANDVVAQMQRAIELGNAGKARCSRARIRPDRTYSLTFIADVIARTNSEEVPVPCDHPV
ncbi:hypothetical protein ACS0TY_026438 [Phlomoides rotata]